MKILGEKDAFLGNFEWTDFEDGIVVAGKDGYPMFQVRMNENDELQVVAVHLSNMSVETADRGRVLIISNSGD